MDRSRVIERVDRVDAACADPSADADAVQAALVAVRELSGWLEARKGVLVGRLRAVSSFPEAVIAEADRSSLGAATKTTERSETLAATPKLADALEDGAITAGHIDAVTRSSKQMNPEQREELLERADALVAVAAAGTVDDFRRRLELEAKRLQADDGMDRLERQRRATRLSTWVDPDGMWNLRGRFDPVTGIKLAAKLDTTLEGLFTDRTPDTAPADPIEKQHHLRALALAHLIQGAGGGGKSGRPEFVAVIDADAPGVTGPVVDWSIPVEIPARVLADLAGDADVHTVVVRNGVVLYAPGELDLGRTTRLANRAQRRALRGMYRTCAIPGCSVHFDRCHLHHIVWWRHDGRTDLANLLPVCTKHHSKIHHDGWTIELGPNRELTLRLPDGTVHTTGPPGRRTAA
ncbi:MAG TPA: HNH endonuclease signature motif containing protein [Ilumatobacteraceae bacterium]|nr:HNH endonuclease signature motif containing protein [Ilumatobacteraceae bacterium]